MRKTSFVTALVWIIGLGAFVGTAATASPEYQLKAAFLVNFARFAEWPETAFAGAEAPVVLCVLGKDPFEGALDQAAKDKLINGRRILIRVSSDLVVLQTCHLIFFPASQMRSFAHTTKALSGSSILSVGEVPDFAERGGIINFVIIDGHIHFEINPSDAQHFNLKLSSRLLRLSVGTGK